MKLPQSVAKLALACSLLSLVPVVTVPGKVKAKDSPKQGTSQYIVAGKPRQLQVNSVDSRLDLELPDLGPDADWVVGVQNTKEGERETVSASLMFWEDSENFPALAGKGLKTKLVSGFTNYPTKKIRTIGGMVSLRRLADFDNDSVSLVVHVKVSPETQVHIRNGGKQYTSGFPRSSFIVHNGAVVDRQIKGYQSLVGSLLRDKIAPLQSEREKSRNLTSLMRTAPLSSRLRPVRAAFSPRATPVRGYVTCTVDSVEEEETEECWAVSFGISCTGGIQCSFTVSVCGSAEVQIIAFTGGCNVS